MQNLLALTQQRVCSYIAYCGTQKPQNTSGGRIEVSPPLVFIILVNRIRALLLELYTMKAEPEPGLGICG
jgi:hypothetical protein